MITILHSQNIIDISIQEYGTALNAFQLAKLNGLSVTDTLVAGQKLLPLVNAEFVAIEIKNHYKNKGIKPATAQVGYVLQGTGGIGEMTINETFIVN